MKIFNIPINKEALAEDIERETDPSKKCDMIVEMLRRIDSDPGNLSGHPSAHQKPTVKIEIVKYQTMLDDICKAEQRA